MPADMTPRIQPITKSPTAKPVTSASVPPTHEVRVKRRKKFDGFFCICAESLSFPESGKNVMFGELSAGGTELFQLVYGISPFTFHSLSHTLFPLLSLLSLSHFIIVTANPSDGGADDCDAL